MLSEDSSWRHLCLEEVSGGVLTPSFEETLVSNCLRSVREESIGGSWEDLPDMVSFVFLLFFILLLHTHLFLFLLCCQVKKSLHGLFLL